MEGPRPVAVQVGLVEPDGGRPPGRRAADRRLILAVTLIPHHQEAVTSRPVALGLETQETGGPVFLVARVHAVATATCHLAKSWAGRVLSLHWKIPFLQLYLRLGLLARDGPRPVEGRVRREVAGVAPDDAGPAAPRPHAAASRPRDETAPRAVESLGRVGVEPVVDGPGPAQGVGGVAVAPRVGRVAQAGQAIEAVGPGVGLARPGRGDTHGVDLPEGRRRPRVAPRPAPLLGLGEAVVPLRPVPVTVVGVIAPTVVGRVTGHVARPVGGETVRGGALGQVRP